MNYYLTGICMSMQISVLVDSGGSMPSLKGDERLPYRHWQVYHHLPFPTDQPEKPWRNWANQFWLCMLSNLWVATEQGNRRQVTSISFISFMASMIQITWPFCTLSPTRKGDCLDGQIKAFHFSSQNLNLTHSEAHLIYKKLKNTHTDPRGKRGSCRCSPRINDGQTLEGALVIQELFLVYFPQKVLEKLLVKTLNGVWLSKGCSQEKKFLQGRTLWIFPGSRHAAVFVCFR